MTLTNADIQFADRVYETIKFIGDRDNFAKKLV
ncbi:hypothetical protein Xen7305DRAFT_00005780 [Xenococcus sp. PCC 7305]|nr:hypothetical protein Xen7305DRAFT_00005780 [Xenococcus sp. PCC 7305]